MPADRPRVDRMPRCQAMITDRRGGRKVCNKLLAIELTRPYKIDCPRCKAEIDRE